MNIVVFYVAFQTILTLLKGENVEVCRMKGIYKSSVKAPKYNFGFPSENQKIQIVCLFGLRIKLKNYKKMLFKRISSNITLSMLNDHLKHSILKYIFLFLTEN